MRRVMRRSALQVRVELADADLEIVRDGGEEALLERQHETLSGGRVVAGHGYGIGKGRSGVHDPIELENVWLRWDREPAFSVGPGFGLRGRLGGSCPPATRAPRSFHMP